MRGKPFETAPLRLDQAGLPAVLDRRGRTRAAWPDSSGVFLQLNSPSTDSRRIINDYAILTPQCHQPRDLRNFGASLGATLVSSIRLVARRRSIAGRRASS